MDKNKDKEFISREEQEKLEGHDTQNVDVPDSRYQTKQQKPVVNDTKANTDNNGFSVKKVKTKGAVLKQEAVARVVDKGIGGEVPESAVQANSLSYGGNEGTILGAASYTPSVGQSRSDSRVGKKLDAIAKKLNFVPPELVEIDFDESAPLAKNPEKVQGYNGSPRNTNARSQKIVGGVPGELLFQRSIDEIKRDQLYATTGQVIKEQGVIYNDTPTIIPEKDNTGVWHYGNNDNYELNRGNYLHRNMRIKFDNLGRLTKMTFDVIDASVTDADTTVINDASANHIIDMNYAEMDRTKMDHKAGDEKADIWTPLARAVKQPSRTIAYLRDIENITGSEVFLAYKKTAMCMSYQLNRAAKDGMKIHGPMLEAALGLIYPEDSSERFGGDISNLWKTDEYVRGASSLFIAIYDSTTKYTTKADLLLMPRAYKLALQTADNNMNPLRLKSDYVKVVNSREVFSTIDREYDPTLPVCISDHEANVHCYNFNDLYSFSSLDEAGNPVMAKSPFIYMYDDLRNNYVVTAVTPLLRGLHKYLDSIGPKIVSLNNGALINQEIVIPMIHSTCHFSLWSLLVLSATPFIVRERINSLKDVLYYEKNVEYPFHQLIDIRSANPLNGVQYSQTSLDMPLKTKQMTPACALSWILPEMFWAFDEDGSSYKYVLPWYTNQVEFNFTPTGATRAPGKYAISMPSIRNGARLGSLDSIYSMEERDVRLSLDRLITYPKFTLGSKKQGVYKYGQNTDGVPFFTIADSDYTIEKFLKCARELGWFIVAPAGLLTITGQNGLNFAASNAPVYGQTSYRAKFWHGRIDDTVNTGEILQPTTINVNRATAYKQDWDCIQAIIGSTAPSSSKDWGFLLSLNNVFDHEGNLSLVPNKGVFTPFTNGVRGPGGSEGVLSDSKVFEIVSLQKALWTRVQVLFFALSPFDTISYRNVGEDALKVDPYDFCYYFGLSGFKASEYDEDVYNRSTAVIDLGFSFLEDPFMVASPLFKEAGTFTQSDNSASLIK